MLNLLLLTACGLAEADAEVAAVMLTTGDAWVERGDEKIPAAIGFTLLSTDTLVTGENGAIIVHLHNDHLVRIDAELDLTVSDIVMLEAPKSTIPPGEQLADFLYPEESAAMGSDVTRAEAVAGWHSRLVSAESVSGMRGGPPVASAPIDAGEEESGPVDSVGSAEGGGGTPEKTGKRDTKRNKERAEEKKEHSSGGKDSRNFTSPKPRPRPAAAAAPMPAPAPEPDEPVASGGEDAYGSEPLPGAPPKPPPPPEDDADRRMTDETVTSDEIETWFEPEGALRECIDTWAAELGIEIETVTVRVRVVNGTVTRLGADRGLRLPTCARKGLEGARVTDATTQTLEFKVLLQE